MDRLHIVIAGSTAHTVMCAEALLQDKRFECVGVVTPQPKRIGRRQQLTQNPLHAWAEANHLPVELLTEKITAETRLALQQWPQPDIFLVVDFGYFIPEWMIRWPRIAPVNIHPSRLPRWRGASPGQFTLLAGEKDSAVSVIVMNSELDSGPIITQIDLPIFSSYTAGLLYDRAFAQISEVLPNLIASFAAHPDRVTPQPPASPTPMARRLTKEDSFIAWEVLQAVMAGTAPTELATTSPLLAEFAQQANWPVAIERAVRAFQPWPLVWTIIPTANGPKRMQILKAELDAAKISLVLEEVKIEGSHSTKWSEVKNVIQ